MTKITTAVDYDGTFSVGITPAEPFYVITGRKKNDIEDIKQELKKRGRSEVKIIPYPKDDLTEENLNEKIGTFKGEAIKKLGIKKFFEDSEEQAKVIKQLNPDLELIMVKDSSPMKFIFFTLEHENLPIAEKLIKEGNSVIVGEIIDTKQTLTDKEQKGAKPEDPEIKKRRLSQYVGMVKKYPAETVLKMMKKLSNKDDYFVFPDLNHLFRYTTIASKMGFTQGLFPTQEDRMLEVERDMGKEIVQKHYKELKVAEVHEFKSAQDGITFLQETENAFVLKGQGDTGETIVPTTDDVLQNNQQVIDALERETKSYEEHGFILEQRIMDPVEMTPQLVFWNGEPVYATVDFETKKMMAGELGPTVGCGTNLVLHVDIDDPICKIAFPPYVYEQAKKHKGMFVWDAGILFDRTTDTPYFTEFCSNRVGWDSFPTEVAMAGDRDGEQIATPYFKNLVKGKDPMRARFGCGVRIFNLDEDDNRYASPDLSITVDEDAEPDTYLYFVKKNEDKVVTSGLCKDIGVITGVADTLKEAIERCYAYVKMVGVKNIAFRNQDDFLSTSYPQAILKRLQYAVEKKLIKDNGILDQLKALREVK